MLAIEQHFAPFVARGNDALADAREAFFNRALKRNVDMIIPRLRDEADCIRVGVEQRRDARIVGRRTPCPLGHPESAEFCTKDRFFRKELGVERIGAGIAALDIIDADPVEQARDGALVFQRKIDAGGLRAVAQRGVVEIKAFAAS